MKLLSEEIVLAGLAGRFVKWNQITQAFQAIAVSEDFIPPYDKGLDNQEMRRRNGHVGGKCTVTMKNNAHSQWRPWSASDLQRARGMRANGATWVEIGRTFNIGADCARRRCGNEPK